MRVLVVEDEHRIANTIQKGLEQERFTVDVAYDGIDGYDLAATTPYDVIVLDRMLSGMDGLSVCKNLRLKNIHTPILILTARGQTTDKIEGFESGADDYLTKPFSFEELIARIRALSRRSKTISTALLTVGDLTLDTQSFLIERDNKAINLSGKEYALLEYMMRNKGKILTKEQIIDHVWNYDSDILPNTIEVYIRKLRNKIDRPFSDKKELLTTVRGFGYKID